MATICERRGVTNFHNKHVYEDENPHVIKEKYYQNEFTIKVWAGIIGNHIQQRLTGEYYLQHLQNTLEGLSLQLQRDMWFMHDGVPPHYSINAPVN